MIVLPILLVVVLLQLATEAIDADIVLRTVTGPYAIVGEVLLMPFLALLKGVVSPVLQDPAASEGVIAGLEGLAKSLRHFDASLTDSLTLITDILQIHWMFAVYGVDLKALV